MADSPGIMDDEEEFKNRPRDNDLEKEMNKNLDTFSGAIAAGEPSGTGELEAT